MQYLKNKNINTGLFLLVASYIYIIFVTLGYDSAWMLPEVFKIKNAIVKMMHSESGMFWPLTYIFRFDVFEFGPRTTRPLSSLFEIADTFCRVHLWKIMTPHPSLSLTFIFTLILSPYCLYKLLRNWELTDNQAKIAVSFYLVQPGTLSLIVMYFRPAKTLAIFFMILSFLLASIIRKRYASHEKPGLPVFICLFLSLTAGFLFDETAAVFYFAFLILFFGIVIRSKKFFIAFTSIPFMIAALYFYVFPLISVLLHSSRTVFADYIADELIINIYLPFIKYSLLSNFRVLFKESLILFSPGYTPSLAFKILFGVQQLIVGGVLVYFCFHLIGQIRNRSLKSGRYELLIKAFLVVLWGGLAHGLFMNITSNNIWGPYWYGSYIGVFFALLIAGFYKIQDKGLGRMVTVAAASTIILSMLTFPYLNFVYKKYHYYPHAPIHIQQFFEWELNRFEISRNDVPRDIRDSIERTVRQSRLESSPEGIIVIPELMWLPIELGVPQNNPG
jgi:hypothetical protein